MTMNPWHVCHLFMKCIYTFRTFSKLSHIPLPFDDGMQLRTLNRRGWSENAPFVMIATGHTVTCWPMVKTSICSKLYTKPKAAFSKRRIVI